jgi:hypothetical protein
MNTLSYYLSVFLLTLHALAVTASKNSSSISSFNCAISTLYIKAGDAPYSVCKYTSVTGQAAITLQWYTAGPISKKGDGGESVQISIWLDGILSLQYYPYQLAGMPSFESFNATPATNTWSSALFGRYSATSWNSNIAIPFNGSLEITLQYIPPTGGATIYYQAHGIDGVQQSFNGIQLPSHARLQLQTQRLTLPALAYLPIVTVPAGNTGVIAGIAIAFTAPNLNTLEGCFHLYTTSTTPYPGQLHSTGTEDEFISSYYFDLGVFQGRSAGIFYKVDAPASISMYRNYQDDAMVVNDGGSFVWRNGDTSDDTGVKCMVQTGGHIAGNPGAADTQTQSWVYVWSN